jgi:hypothetical protein
MTDTDPTYVPRRGRGAEPIEVPEVTPPTRAYAEVGGPVVPVSLRWDGVPTEFILAHPLVRDHRVLHEGSVVRFNVMPHPDPTKRGVFIGSDDPAIPDESQHVMELYAQGMFAGSAPAVDRARRQNAIDFERGVMDGGEGGASMASLAPLNGARTEEMLRRHRGIGTPEQMRAAERVALREGAAPAWPGAEAPGTARRTGPQP